MLSDDIGSLAAAAKKLETEVAEPLKPTLQLLCAELQSFTERARALESVIVPFAARLDRCALQGDNVIAIPVLR